MACMLTKTIIPKREMKGKSNIQRWSNSTGTPCPWKPEKHSRLPIAQVSTKHLKPDSLFKRIPWAENNEKMALVEFMADKSAIFRTFLCFHLFSFFWTKTVLWKVESEILLSRTFLCFHLFSFFGQRPFPGKWKVRSFCRNKVSDSRGPAHTIDSEEKFSKVYSSSWNCIDYPFRKTWVVS